MTRNRHSAIRGAALATSLIAAALAATPAAAATRSPTIEVLSDRADVISGGDALVAVDLPGGASPAGVRVSAGGRDVSGAFALRPNGRFEGLVTGLPAGPTLLTARLANGRSGRATIVNHPNGGPVFTGPQVQPWVCQSSAKDRQCNEPTTYKYMYKSSTTGSLQPYDPSSPPPDVATTTTDQGVTVPFVIRIETGYQDRDQYQIATLYQPGKPWSPWAPQPQWNHKLLITHGASCAIDHQSGTAPSVTGDTVGGSSPTVALGRGFAVMSTALDNAGHNCSLVTEAESLVMAKEHLVESYGTIRYTIGTGCSGGSLVQQQVANAYPGIYQGILPQCSFPDAWSTGQQLAAYHLTRRYFENPALWGPGIAWTPNQVADVEGHPNHVNAVILDSLYFTALGDPTNPCAGVPASQRYDPQKNPHGVRCTLADYMVNVMGRRAQDGFGARPLDDVGWQVGLRPLLHGDITPAQFVDINNKFGGADIDAKWTPQRVVADEPGLRNVYRSGGVNETNNLDQVAIIDLRGPDPGAFHDVYRAFAVRARLQREHGTYANQVIWEGFAPLIGDTQFTTLGLLAMDRWLAAVEKDGRRAPLAQKIIADKPRDVHDQCSDGVGQVLPDQRPCQAVVQSYTTPAIESGESITTDTLKCQLKPLVRSDYYPVQFTDDEFAQLQRVFPGGVCDFSKPGIDQQPTIPWQTYQDASGNVVYGGRALGAAPPGSGGGWTSPAFDAWRQQVAGASVRTKHHRAHRVHRRSRRR